MKALPAPPSQSGSEPVIHQTSAEKNMEGSMLAGFRAATQNGDEHFEGPIAINLLESQVRGEDHHEIDS